MVCLQFSMVCCLSVDGSCIAYCLSMSTPVSGLAMLVCLGLLNLCIWWIVLSVVIVACPCVCIDCVCTSHFLSFFLLGMLIQCLVALHLFLVAMFTLWSPVPLVASTLVGWYVAPCCIPLSILQSQIVWYCSTTFGMRVVWKSGVKSPPLKLVWFVMGLWKDCIWCDVPTSFFTVNSFEWSLTPCSRSQEEVPF